VQREAIELNIDQRTRFETAETPGGRAVTLLRA
jgi:hypothetical protein